MSSSTDHVALLRGINVGGRNKLPMADLRSALESSGLRHVRTYIQSGNVVFDAGDLAGGDTAVAEAVGSVIRDTFGLDVPVVTRTLDDLERIAGAHPDAAGDVPPKWLLVYVLDRPADPADAPDPGRFGSDRLVVDGREIYATYPAGSGRSKLSIDVIERSFGVLATARNLSTLGAIVALGRRS
jgi:uncharacterized protein (DUF1697 family)